MLPPAKGQFDTAWQTHEWQNNAPAGEDRRGHRCMEIYELRTCQAKAPVKAITVTIMVTMTAPAAVPMLI